MIRLIYKNTIFEMSELANYRLYELACQIIIASGYVSSYEVLKYTAIFLTIKKNRLYIDHIQDALGRKRKIDCPLILLSGVIYYGKRKRHYPKLDDSNFEDVGVVCILNGKVVEVVHPVQWFADTGLEVFQTIPEIETLRNLLESEGVHCNIKTTVFY